MSDWTDRYAREAEQERLIEEWAQRCDPATRAKLAKLPKVDSRPSHDVGFAEDAGERASLTFSGDSAVLEQAANHRAAMPDPSEWCDGEADRLMEDLDLTPGQAAAVVEWGRAQVEREVRGSEVRAMAVVLGRLLGDEANDLRLMLWALAFQTGVARMMTQESAAAKATKLGKSRQLMSHWMRVWEKELGWRDMTYSKTHEARARMSAGRKRVVARYAQEGKKWKS